MAMEGSDLSTCDQLIPIWRPRQREWALADLDFAHTSLGPYIPEPDHAIGSGACEFILVDWVEGNAFEGCCRVGRAQFGRVLSIRLFRVPDAQCPICGACRDECARGIP